MGRWSNNDTSVEGTGRGYRALALTSGDPDHLFWSYATGYAQMQGPCSGTLVGPNLLLTAGHCGHAGFAGWGPGIFQAVLYSEGSDDGDITNIIVSCETLVQNNGQGDFQFAWCDDVPLLNGGVGVGLPPGEFFGMADFDFTPVQVGQDVWTSWQNPHCPGAPAPNNCAGPPQLIFSPGKVTNANTPLLGFPGAFITDQRLARGSSGSGVWTQSNGSIHRLVSSGFAIGSFFEGTAGGPGSTVSGIPSVLANSTVAGNPVGVHSAKLMSLGLTDPARGWSLSDYAGKLDVAPANGEFDVRERLDQVFGVNTGKTTWLGFGSPRVNRMWQQPSSAVIQFFDLNSYARIDYQDQGDEEVLVMPRVGFAGNSINYRMSIMSYTDQSSEPDGLAIEVWEPGAGSPDAVIYVPTPANSQWQMHTAELQIPGVWKEVRVRVRGSDYGGSIAALTFVAQGSWNTFNSHAERLNWRNNETGKRAWIVPYGDRANSNEMSWAGLVFDEDKNIAEEYTLRNRQMAVDPDLQYAVCYRVRSFPAGSSGVGKVVLGSGAAWGGPNPGPNPPDAPFVEQDVTITPDWTNECTSGFQAGGTDNLLKFGHVEGQPEYLIDRVRVVQQ